jgi:YceI-like domain
MLGSLRHFRRCGFLALGLVLASVAEAPSQNTSPPAESKPAAAKPAPRPGDVMIERSRVYVHTGVATRIGHEHGIAGELASGNLQLGAMANAGKLVFDMSSFADEPEARTLLNIKGDEDAETRKKVNESMHGASQLNVNKYPHAVFDIRAAALMRETKKDAPPTYQLDGTLTLHGKSQPLRVEAQAETVDGAVRLRGHFTLLQTEYGIRPYAKFGGVIGVANEVKVSADIWLVPQPAK